ncbi:MAG: TerB family tellurite resistance protein [Archangium sp.]|nr:TerB family tellurite resistance protein [Archangium sp.]
MTVRKILSARSARPKVEGMLEALVEAAVFIGGSDGRFGEEELNVFIDTMREVVTAAVGDELVDSMAATPKLLDQARTARKSLSSLGEEKYLAALAPKFLTHGPFARDGMVLAWRVVLADGRVTDNEASAFERLAGALHVHVDEVRVLKELAAKSEAASKLGHRGENIEHLNLMVTRGWLEVTAEGFDAGVEHAQTTGEKLRLELDASESALHVHVGASVHLVCLFGESLPALLAVLDGLRNSLMPSTLEEKLPAIRAVCPEVFVERDGKFVKL